MKKQIQRRITHKRQLTEVCYYQAGPRLDRIASVDKTGQYYLQDVPPWDPKKVKPVTQLEAMLDWIRSVAPYQWEDKMAAAVCQHFELKKVREDMVPNSKGKLEHVEVFHRPSGNTGPVRVVGGRR